MQKLLNVVGVGYIIYAVLVAFFVISRIANVLMTIEEDIGVDQIPLSDYVPLITLGIIGVIIFILISTLSYLLFKRTHRTACLILSIILLIGFPVGTLLGIVTIIVLTRNTIKEQFSS